MTENKTSQPVCNLPFEVKCFCYPWMNKEMFQAFSNSLS